MNRLTKDQRDRILAIAMGTVMILVALWFGLIRSQRAALAASEKQMAEAQTKIKEANVLLNAAASYEQLHAQKRAELDAIESGMGSGDLYFWITSTLTGFKTPYQVDIPNYFPPTVGKLGLLPSFPYQAATFKIDGTAYYHEFGKFIANFENKFPYMQVHNIDLGPATGIESIAAEKLKFSMQIVALVKPGQGK